jgi:hypothetical protein
MQWSFKREAWWLLIFALIPVALILGSLILVWLKRMGA